MASHLFKHADNITAFNLGKRRLVKGSLIDYIAFRSSDAYWQVLGQQNLPSSHCKGVFDGVLQLSYIARPLMGHQHSHCFVRKTARRLAMLQSKLVQEVMHQERNVFTAVLQVG